MISKKLKDLRKQHHVTQKAFADDIFVSQQAVSMWEIDRNDPDLETFCKIADYFGVSADYLLDRISDGGTAIANGTNSTAAAGHAQVTLSVPEPDANMEAEFLGVYRSLDLRNKAKLITAAYELLEAQNGKG